MGAQTYTTYITPVDFRRSPTGLESDSLVSNLTNLSSSIAIGAISLPLFFAVSSQIDVNETITIFDGMNSETVLCTASTPPGSAAIPVTATVYAHASGTPVCGDGPQGSLAQMIVNASKWAENITQQSLFYETYTNETLRMPSMRASIDNQNILIFRPRHFPVVSDAGITISQNVANPISFDATQIILDGEAQVVSVPWVTMMNGLGGGGSTYSLLSKVSRSTNLWLRITYVAGWQPLPADVQEAMICLVSELLSKRQNPTLATSFALESKHITRVSARDLKGQGSLVSRAEYLLDFYKVRPY